jgi:CheY-like chemotaxis protein
VRWHVFSFRGRLTFKLLLGGEGYAVTTAASPAELVAAVRTQLELRCAIRRGRRLQEENTRLQRRDLPVFIAEAPAMKTLRETLIPLPSAQQCRSPVGDEIHARHRGALHPGFMHEKALAVLRNVVAAGREAHLQIGALKQFVRRAVGGR